ncbi:uracil-DNA glycosylase [Inhella inkyongensis]|uniref:Uracil-DNA glycosylase n=1 Tax=Inhella inkyongensis TaxID=392593 RepID=A0A840S843_9BURK|nr:uracil-DNA glycosylase [Inhella inkyongensis]MBB5205843.1 uracil-DNA glycosylase [Inhella inkyongensis]
MTQPLGRCFDDEALAVLDPQWQVVLRNWRQQEAAQQLIRRIEARQREGATIYPSQPLRALAATPLANCRVLLLGQDPYHGPGQAEGLAFSVPPGQAIPPSLRNIFKELHRDLGLQPPMTGHLGAWARRGVLLLNTSLTVEAGQAGAHARWGWEGLTDALISAVDREGDPKVFLLWGSHAQAKRSLIGARHRVLCTNHPSPLSALRPPVPFMGCGHFSESQAWLERQGRPWSWNLDKDFSA